MGPHDEAVLGVRFQRRVIHQPHALQGGLERIGARVRGDEQHAAARGLAGAIQEAGTVDESEAHADRCGGLAGAGLAIKKHLIVLGDETFDLPIHTSDLIKVHCAVGGAVDGAALLGGE